MSSSKRSDPPLLAQIGFYVDPFGVRELVPENLSSLLNLTIMGSLLSANFSYLLFWMKIESACGDDKTFVLNFSNRYGIYIHAGVMLCEVPLLIIDKSGLFVAQRSMISTICMLCFSPRFCTFSSPFGLRSR